MSFWQRGLFSILSLVFGWYTFDLVIMALGYMHITSGDQGNEVFFRFFEGCGILIVLLFLLTLYLLIIRRLSGNLNIIEYKKADEKPKVRNKWFDIFLQGGILATGFFLRFFFIMVFYLPKVTG